MTKCNAYFKAIEKFDKESQSREYNTNPNITEETRLAYMKREMEERNNLLERFGGKVIVAKGDEDKSPLLQKRKYVFDDGSETEWI